MGPKNYEHRFEVKPGRFVYVPTDDAARHGKALLRPILKRYKPSKVFYHIGRRGGHVAALRLHRTAAYFSRFDIQNFFGQIVRSRVCRALRSVGFGQKAAFDIAHCSVVVEDGRKVLPYGFVQSPLLATLALQKSALGAELLRIAADSRFRLSVYMDDILISSNDRDALATVSAAVVSAAKVAGFPLSPNKLVAAQPQTEAFNCLLGHNQVILTEARLERFVDQHRGGHELSQQAIEKYVAALSKKELRRLLLALA